MRENNKLLNRSVEYAYDMYGNIIQKKEAAYTGSVNLGNYTTISYGYDGTKLKSYNGEKFVYDKVGNPTTYRGKTAIWEKGRQLRSYNGVTFEYDGKGRRTKKGNITFTYDGQGNIISQSNGLEFLLDATGVIGVKYDGNHYFYRKDIQGNIIALLDGNGNVVVQYVYDAWGNHAVLDANGNDITGSTHIGNLNPYRYRGYYYDTETGLYYLQTRYYDPEICRFMTIDGIEYVDPQDPLHGRNLYAYCGNDPVMHIKGDVSIRSGGIVDSFVLGGYGGGVGSQSVHSASEWLKIGAGAIPDVILGLKYLCAKGIHNKFVYSTNTLYMFPELGANWSRFKIAKNGYGDLIGASFKQIITGNARAGFGAIAKSFGKTAALTGLINFGFNLYENNWKIDGAMLLDTAIDTAIGLGAYGLAVGTTSLVVGGLAMAGLAIPGVVVVGGIMLLSIGFDWLIREITGYKN